MGMILGSHVNFGAEQLVGTTKQALSFGANTYMFYTGAPQNTRRSVIKKELIEEAKKLMKENNIDINNVVCHAPYIINLANREKEEAWNFSIAFLKQEINRIEELGVKYIVVHPGNSLQIERNAALRNISDALNFVLKDDDNVMILLETMAGKGTECGKDIIELKEIIDNVVLKDKVGVCLDTCHLNDSGIDISKFDEYLDEFDKIIGLDKVKCVHVNDSKNIIGAKKDRHENFGYGTIGFDNLINVVYNPKLKDVPKILETPWIGDYPPYKFEIEMIKNKQFKSNLSELVNNYFKNDANF